MGKVHSITVNAYRTDCLSNYIAFDGIESVFLIEIFDEQVHSDAHADNQNVLIHQLNGNETVGVCVEDKNGK